jgi:Sec-independent protein secretion pathway component TatC
VIFPEYVTAPLDKRSKWLSRVIHVLGPIGFERTTPLGTVLSISLKILKQIDWKDVWVVIVWTVAF